MSHHHFAALDLGAESGRSILGAFTNGRLTLEEIHRFPNIPVHLPTGLYWNTLGLYSEIERGLTMIGRQRRIYLEGVGVDTWGVDFGLLGRDGALVDLPRHYRDVRTHGIFAKTFAAVPRERIFRQTGIQFMEINSLYQLHALRLEHSPALESAETLLFMPDLFNYWLSGVKRAEVSIASTSQFYDPRRHVWAEELLHALGVPPRLLPEIVAPGTPLGPLLPAVAERCGLPGTILYATCGHDTASAVAAVPANGARWGYISSGTWSLMGIERPEPVINDDSLALNFTNEVGAGGRIRLLKNIAGLWILQECRRAWAAEGREYPYEELVRMAAEAEPFQALLDPDAFLEPGKMPEKIAAWCARTRQPIVTEPGSVTRCILESLALCYRQTLESLERLAGHEIDTIHIVGGGSRNALLNQYAANAMQRRVIAGPSEATAVGNVLVQAIGAGLFSSLEEARAVVRNSFAVEEFQPREREEWEKAYVRYREQGASSK